ncbi:WD40 repeat-like protein [Paxillus ammoniavirescens]|nr:WD40 repeat-like protein [Paxillus ammoniavirescens]
MSPSVPTTSTPSTESMLCRPVPKRPSRDGTKFNLFEGAPYVDTKALPLYPEAPKRSSHTPLKVLKGHTKALRGLAFFPDSRRLISGSWDQKLIIWDLTSGEVEKELTGHTDWINSVAVAPDGSVIASGSEDSTLRLWDGTTGNKIGEPISVHSLGYRGVWGVSFSPDGQRVAATCGGTVRIWDVQTHALITGPLRISGQGSCTTTFSSDGSRIAADAGGVVHIWDSVSGAVIFGSFKGHTGHVRFAAFTPDGQQLVTASLDKTIRRWDLQSGALIGQPLTGHSEDICGGVLSRDGKTLVTASDDRTVRFWDVKTWNQKSTFLQHESRVWRVALSNNGRLLATGGENGGVYIWGMRAIEAEFGNETQDEVETNNQQNQPKVPQGQDKADHGQRKDQPKLIAGNQGDDRKSETPSTRSPLGVPVGFPVPGAGVEEGNKEQNQRKVTEGQDKAERWQEKHLSKPPVGNQEDDKKSETSSGRGRLDILAVAFPVPEARAKASHYDHEGGFWERHNHAGPADATGNRRENLDDTTEQQSDSQPRRRIFKRWKSLRETLPFKGPKDSPSSSPRQKAPGAPEKAGEASPHASPMPSDPPAGVDLAQAHRALEDSREVGSLDPTSTSVLRSHRPMSKFARPRAWTSLWHSSRRDQLEITTAHPATT